MSDSEMPNDKQTLEASIMDFADDVTYSVHDLEDFYLGGLISLESLTKEEGFEQLIKDWLDILPDDEVKEIIKTSQAKDTLKNLIKFYVPPEYTPGSIEQIAHTKTVSSALIQRYIQSVSIQEDYSKHGYLVRPQQVEIELGFLQQIVRKYVILNPRLTTQQFGQRKIIQTLFDIYREAVEKNQVNLIPTRFLKKSSLENLLDTEENKDKQKTRIAIDIVASFSEAEAVTMYRRLTGIEQGSVMDYIL
jgi:dGTPase